MCLQVVNRISRLTLKPKRENRRREFINTTFVPQSFLLLKNGDCDHDIWIDLIILTIFKYYRHLHLIGLKFTESWYYCLNYDIFPIASNFLNKSKYQMLLFINLKYMDHKSMSLNP